MGCDTDPMNSLTAFVDGSNIYGSDGDTAKLLRTFYGGKLATSPSSLLPNINGAFKAGDIRGQWYKTFSSAQLTKALNKLEGFPVWSYAC